MSWDIHRGYTWLKLLQYAYLQRQVSLRKMVVRRKKRLWLYPEDLACESPPSPAVVTLGLVGEGNTQTWHSHYPDEDSAI